MDHTLYSYSLCIALPLMLFFGFSFLFSKTPDKAIFENYLRSRRLMGAALLLLAVNYSVHFFFEIRYLNLNAAILMNLSTYFLCYWLFSSALTLLLNRFYITRRRFCVHLLMWILFSFFSGIVLLVLPEGIAQKMGLTVMAVWLISYGLVLSRRLLRAYHKAITIFDNSLSDDIGTYIRWLSIFTYWAVIFGVGCGAEEETACDSSEQESENIHDSSAGYAEIIGEKVKAWIDTEKYICQGLTIKELSKILHTNRTYLSEYIKTTYNMSFRNWITDLRLEYAKQRMIQYPEKTIAEVAEVSGFLSMSHFIKTFKEKEGCSPAKWKKTNHVDGGDE